MEGHVRVTLHLAVSFRFFFLARLFVIIGTLSLLASQFRGPFLLVLRSLRTPPCCRANNSQEVYARDKKRLPLGAGAK
jgi:hypothetical protein